MSNFSFRKWLNEGYYLTSDAARQLMGDPKYAGMQVKIEPFPQDDKYINVFGMDGKKLAELVPQNYVSTTPPIGKTEKSYYLTRDAAQSIFGDLTKTGMQVKIKPTPNSLDVTVYSVDGEKLAELVPLKMLSPTPMR